MIGKYNTSLQSIFLSADSDKDGYINTKNLENTFSELFSRDLSKSEVDSIIFAYGLDDKKKYTFKEFLNIFRT